MEKDTIDTINYILENDKYENIYGLSEKKVTPLKAIEYLQYQSFDQMWRIDEGENPNDLIIISQPF